MLEKNMYIKVYNESNYILCNRLGQTSINDFVTLFIKMDTITTYN